ncbi:hypothetical protein CU097_013368, partial [Rhizopus azygosporus]
SGEAELAIGYIGTSWITANEKDKLEYYVYRDDDMDDKHRPHLEIKKKADEMVDVLKSKESHCWIMENGKDIVGTVILKCDQREGKIGYLTGVNSEIRRSLVKNAIQFAKSNKIEVISKWDESTKWTSDNNHL